MNIFFLDRDVETAARFHCDAHVVKMSLETAQILCSVLHRYGDDAPYRNTHKNHPSVLWAGDNLAHFQWTHKFGLALCKEYTHRYCREHKCESIIAALPPPRNMPDIPWTDPPQVTPLQFHSDDVVDTYRQYYREEKSSFKGKGLSTWKTRTVPDFMTMAI